VTPAAGKLWVPAVVCVALSAFGCFSLFFQNWLNPILGTVPGPSYSRGFVSGLVTLVISLVAIASGVVAMRRTTKEARALERNAPSPQMTVALAGMVIAGLLILLVIGVTLIGLIFGLYKELI
jgi:formate hydrogenlyase subunit 3/multisubunit Na+/H+ antiporter MnhD subunit